MQTIQVVAKRVDAVGVGDLVWSYTPTGRSAEWLKVVQVAHELDDTWYIWFEGCEPAAFVEDDTLEVGVEVE